MDENIGKFFFMSYKLELFCIFNFYFQLGIFILSAAKKSNLPTQPVAVENSKLPTVPDFMGCDDEDDAKPMTYDEKKQLMLDIRELNGKLY
jgi:hypothetical protein